MHVRGGTIEVDNDSQKDSAIAIARDRSIKSIPVVKRVPTWVDRPVETINVKQTFLSQIKSSSDVMLSMNQQIRSITANPVSMERDASSLATLAV